MATVTDPAPEVPNITNSKTITERLSDEYVEWNKAKRSGNSSRQMRDARNRMDALLDELSLLRKIETPII